MARTPLRAPSGAGANLTPHLPNLRDALTEQRQFRLDQLAELVGDIPETCATSMDPHDEVTIALHAGATAALADIDNALARMDTGDYGRCRHCSAPIPLERLEILPATPLCMTCQHTAEAGFLLPRRVR